MNRTLSVPASGGLLRAFTDADRDAFVVRLVTPPARGTVVVRADGSFTYAPPPGFRGKVTFTVRAFDGVLFSDPVTVTLGVV
jgi:hypothetical protein